MSDEHRKECTDLSSTYIENSLESLRNAIDMTSIPTTDKHGIEQAVTNLQEVIAPSVTITSSLVENKYLQQHF